MIRKIFIIKNKRESKGFPAPIRKIQKLQMGPAIGIFAARFTVGADRAILPGAGRLPCGRLVRAGQRCQDSSAAIAHPRSPADRPPFTAVPGKGPMSEDERLEMVRTVAEAHAGLREIALRLRRRLPAKAAAAKAAVRAEQEAFRSRSSCRDSCSPIPIRPWGAGRCPRSARAARSSISSGCGAARIAAASAEKPLETAPEARMGR